MPSVSLGGSQPPQKGGQQSQPVEAYLPWGGSATLSLASALIALLRLKLKGWQTVALMSKAASQLNSECT